MNGILDAAAAALMLLGAGFVLIAAIGVARLPDIFVRMHAATKAGVVGVGLLLLGVALSFDEAGAWVRVLPAIVFLIVTTPIAAHALARAAYSAGAQLWSGTFTDHLSEVIPRRVQRLEPSHTAASPRGPAQPWEDTEAATEAAKRTAPDTTTKNTASEVDPMTVLPFESRHAGERHVSSATLTHAQKGICRILVGLVPGEAGRTTIDQSVRLARETGAELVGLSVVDVPAARKVGPTPIGGLHYARRLSEHRLHEARDQAADLVAAFELAASSAGVRYAVRHEEGDPTALLCEISGAFDLVSMPGTGWSGNPGGQQGTVGLDNVLAAGVRPILTGAPARREVRHVLLAHDLGVRAGQTVRWLAQARLWPAATIHVAGTGAKGAAANDGLAEAAAYLAAHGYNAEAIGNIPQASVDIDPLAELPFRCDAVVVANAGGGAKLRRLQMDTAKRLRDCRSTLVLG